MFLTEKVKYDGHLLHQRFAYRYFKKKCNALGDIIAFRGPMEVLADAMIDQEDVMNNAFIYSDDAINFLWEIPILNHAFGAVAYQRLFNSKIANIIATNFIEKNLQMSGDDIMVIENNEMRKASVSITHVKYDVVLGHTGINIEAGSKAPNFAYSLKLNDMQVKQFAEAVIEMFYELNHDIFVATAKILA